MGRTDRRTNTHIQEKKPPPQDNSAPPPAEERPAPMPDDQQRAWRWAATIWAIVFLFLLALAMFDLVAGMFRG
jgi:hypothetical protein